MSKAVKKSVFALLAALVIMGGFSIPAFAAGPAEPEATAKPLTPEGNMTLVDEIEGEASQDKSFIVVQSRGGNYFYIVIDHAAEGENSVHFLNQVDEKDLLSIIEEDGGAQAETPAVCICHDKCIVGDVNVNCPVCKNDMTKCGGAERVVTPEPTEEPQEAPAKSNTGGLIAAVIILALLGGGAAYYFKVIKPKQSAKGTTDLDELDFDEFEDYENEDEETTQEDEA